MSQTHDRFNSQVLYLHPAKQGVGFDYLRIPADPAYELLPVGIVGLVNLLRREGISVHGLNYAGECLIQPGFRLDHWLREHRDPRLILIDLHWYEHSFGAVDLARHCKQMFPDTPLVIGGLTASGFASEILGGAPFIDAVVRGDGEEPLRQLGIALCKNEQALHEIDLDSIPNLTWRREDEIVDNDITYCARCEDLDQLDFVDTSWLDHEDHNRAFQYVGNREPFVPAEGPELLAHWLCIGRGCHFDCSFCGGGSESHRQLANRQGLMVRSPERVISDIARLHEMGVHQVAFSLDPMLMGQAYWKTILGGLRERKIRIGLYNEHFQIPSSEFVREFVETADLAHSELGISVLSHEPVRRRNGKQFGDAQLMRVLSLLKTHRVPLSIYFSLNLPGETLDRFKRTLALADRIGRLYPNELLRMINQPHTVDPFSTMSRDAQAYGIEVSFSSFSDFYSYCRHTGAQNHRIPLDVRHGFRSLERSKGDVEQMAAAWQVFCHRQPFVCS